MTEKTKFYPQAFSLKPFPLENGNFSIKRNKQKFEVTNMTLEGYQLFLGNNPSVYNIKAIPINEIECMICDEKVHPIFFS